MLNDVDIIEIYSSSGYSGVLNRLISAGISVKSAKTEKNKLIIRTYSRDRQKIIVMFDELCYNYQIIKKGGVKSALSFCKSRPALLLGAIAVLLVLILMPQFVYDVKVEGDIDEKAVYTVLSDCGVKRGLPVRKLNLDEVSKRLLSIEGVAFADVDVSGSTVIVRLQGELPPTAIIDVAAGGEMIASVDAVITRQLVFSGTALYKAGDSVKKGDTLISGTLGEGENALTVPARGEVYGLVSYTASVMFTGTRVERVKSGKSSTERIISFIGLEGRAKGSPYAMFETRTESVKSGFFMPLTAKNITYFEIVDVEITESFDEAKDRLTAEALSMATAAVPDAAEIKNKSTTVREIGGNYVVEAVVTCEQRVDNG